MRKQPLLLILAALSVVSICLIGCSSSSQAASESSQSESSGATASAESASADAAKADDGVESDDAVADDDDDVNEVRVKSDDIVDKTKSVKIGDSIKADGYSMSIADAYWEKADESGQLTVSRQDGYTRTVSIGADQWAFVIKANITNKGKKAIDLYTSFYGEATINGKYEYDVSKQVSDGANFSEIEPLETSEIIIYTSVPEKMKKKFEVGELKWALDPKVKSVQSSFDIFDTVYQFKFK